MTQQASAVGMADDENKDVSPKEEETAKQDEKDKDTSAADDAGTKTPGGTKSPPRTGSAKGKDKSPNKTKKAKGGKTNNPFLDKSLYLYLNDECYHCFSVLRELDRDLV